MILPPLAPALLLFGQIGPGGSLPSADPGQAATALQQASGDAAPANQAPAPELQLPEKIDGQANPRPSDSTRKSVRVRRQHAPGDPLEGFNRKMFAVQDGLDRALIRPAAIGYRHVVPKPVRGGLRHFLSNLTEPIVFLNYMLQLKPGKAAETLLRFTVNSTIGIGGVLDVAKLPSIGLPHRPNGFGDTLGYYGVKPGPYLYLPLVGPTDFRDFLGGQADNLTIPVLAAGKPFNQPAYLVPSAVIGGLDLREQNDDDLRALYAGAVDPYASLRSVYLQDRKGEIESLHGRSGHETDIPTLDDTLDDPAHKANTDERKESVLPPPELADPLTDPARDQLVPPAAGPAPSLLDLPGVKTNTAATPKP